ncbi:MAG: MFS transporter [Variibacter sp.]
MVDVLSGVGQPETQSVGSRKRQIALAAGMIGHSLEWYDFAVYAFVATQIASHFFPSSSGTASLLAALATFGVGFVARPIGGVLFGRVADSSGRRTSLIVSYVLMAIATVAMGLLPSYQSIGILAPILLVAARLLQGLAAGGEVAGAIVFLVEWGGNGRRGLAGSFHQVGSGVGFLLGSLVVALLTTLLSTEAMQEWGWRIPFLLGAVIGPLGYLLRRNVDETPEFVKIKESGAAVPDLAMSEWLRFALRAFLFNAFWSIIFYFFLTYLPTYAQRELHLSSAVAFWVSTATLFGYVFLLPLFGHISDRVGRKPLFIASCLGFAVFLYPVFSHLSVDNISTATYFGVSVLFVTFLAMFAGPAPAMISEIFPTKKRGTFLGLGYSMGTVVFGGFTPFIALWLTDKFASPLAPIVYIIVAAVISGAYILTLKETAHDQS